MCERCRNEDMSDRPVEERLKQLEDRQYLLLQTAGKLVDEMEKITRDHEAMANAFHSFALKVMVEIPSLRTGMEEYIEMRATHVGEADQMKKKLDDLLKAHAPAKPEGTADGQ